MILTGPGRGRTAAEKHAVIETTIRATLRQVGPRQQAGRRHAESRNDSDILFHYSFDDSCSFLIKYAADSMALPRTRPILSKIDQLFIKKINYFRKQRAEN